MRSTTGSLLFYTGVTRKASDILTEQRRNIVSDPKTVDNLSRIRDQADELHASLARGNLDAIGTSMHEGWVRKKQMASGVSSAGVRFDL